MEIRTLSADEKISEPGFWNIPLDVHHSQCCDGPSVTSGILRKMELATPADVFAFHELNPNRWPRQETDALRLGRAMAAYVEGGMEAVAQHFRVLPADKPRRPTEAQVKAYEEQDGIDPRNMVLIPEDAPRRPTEAQIKAYDEGKGSEAAKASVEFWRKVDAMGKTPIRKSEIEQKKALKRQIEFWRAIDADPRAPLTDAEQTMIENMGLALAADPSACAVMGGLPEITMAFFDESTRLWVLSRPDTVSFDGIVTDYKKISSQGAPFDAHLVDRRITTHGYDMQLALAAEAFENLVGEWPGAAGVIAQWDQPPHHVILREIAEEDLRIAQWRNRRALTRFRECLDAGHWPGPGEVVGAYQRPDWLRDQIQNAMAPVAAQGDDE